MEQLSSSAGGGECAEAMGTVRLAKNCFWWLVLLSVLVQLAGFAAVRFGGVVDEAQAVVDASKTASAPEPPPGPPAATRTAASVPATVHAPLAPASTSAEYWYVALAWALPGTKFLGMIAGLALLGTLGLAVQVVLVGRSGGAGGFVAAFFWALLLWVFLIPWQQVLNSSLATGALFNLHDLLAQTRAAVWEAGSQPLAKSMPYYFRFGAYPLFALVLLLAVQARFARGYRRMRLAVTEAAAAGGSEPGFKI